MASAGDTLNDSVRTVVERRELSRKYMQANYWDEFEDVYRAVKCRTKPITVKDRKGNDVEDTTRTNVAMPELSLIVRRKTARLTANPPQINYITPDANRPDGGPDVLGEKLTALAYQDFDRSGEAREHRIHVQQAMTFGWSVSKLFWDAIEVTRQFRYDRSKLTDRKDLMEKQGAAPDEIEQAVAELGPTLSDDEVSQSIAENGPELKAKIPTTLYEGPVVKTPFIGDIHIEPGATTLNKSSYIVEEYTETDLWLQKMSKRTYCDPETGEEVPVFDPDQMQKLLDMGSVAITEQEKLLTLRNRLRDSLNQQRPQIDKRLLPGKRFDILEDHSPDEFGQWWTTWIGNEKIPLGRQPYPWDLYGRSCYTEYVPLPDLISAIGDSTPRLLRFLYAMHNAAVGQRQDLINQQLRPLVFVRREEDVPEEVINRALLRVMVVKDPNSFKYEQPLVVPQAAWETENQIMRMMGLAEPSLNNVEAGSEVNPAAGKTATTAVLAAKSADALTQFDLDGLNQYLKELGEKKLAMRQQQQQGAVQVSGKYVKTEALSQRYGKTSMVTVEALEFQQEIGVEPETNSMLSVEDELRKNSVLQAYQLAVQSPGLYNMPYLATKLVSTMHGIDADKAVISQPGPPPPPPPQPPRVNISMTAKAEDMPADIVEAAFTAAGVSVTPEASLELAHSDTLRGVGKLSQAADAAVNLHAPGEPPPQPNPAPPGLPQ